MTPNSIAATLAVLALAMIRTSLADSQARSFQHFHGPVIGEAQEISWKDEHGHHHHDYVAEPRYEFSYGVEDHHTGDFHGQKERRDGKEVVGEYTVKEPDGNLRTVKYRAGKDGFHAHVVNSKDVEQGHADHQRR